jgi:hypothetical protein
MGRYGVCTLLEGSSQLGALLTGTNERGADEGESQAKREPSKEGAKQDGCKEDGYKAGRKEDEDGTGKWGEMKNTNPSVPRHLHKAS